MKNLSFINKVSILIIALFYLNLYGQDYLETATITGDGVTTDASIA